MRFYSPSTFIANTTGRIKMTVMFILRQSNFYHFTEVLMYHIGLHKNLLMLSYTLRKELQHILLVKIYYSGSNN